MTGNGKMRGIAAVITGIAASAGICLGLLAGLARLVLQERIGDRGMQIAIPAVLAGVTWMGCLFASSLVEMNRWIAIAAVVAGIAGILLIAGLAIDGTFHGALYNLSAVMAGGGLSCVLCRKKPGKSGRRKRMHR